MTTKHLTDEEVQRYALDDSSTSNHMVAHIHSCEDCKGRVQAYRMLITGIEQQPAPVFDFDLQKLILSQLPAPGIKKAKDNLLARVLILPALLCGGLVICLFWDYFPGLFAGITTMVVYLVAVSAIILLAVLCIDMYKTHNKKMNMLDPY